MTPSATAAPPGYDPLAVPDVAPSVVDLEVMDGPRQRAIPLRVYLPAQRRAPVILFSHGLGGSRAGSAYLGQHWARRGFACVYVQHHGSDAELLTGAAPGEGMGRLRRGANLDAFLDRVRDIPAVLDALAAWNGDPAHPLGGRLEPSKVGMAGHSFGAITTQAVSGQSTPRGPLFTDRRIAAALALSPSKPTQQDADRAFGRVAIPWMLMTGTLDTAPIGNQTVADRLSVFPALPPGDKYELVLDGAEHSAFTDRALPMDRQPRNPNHHRVILALSTAFFEAHLTGDARALAWLRSAGPRALMEAGDRWQTK